MNKLLSCMVIALFVGILCAQLGPLTQLGSGHFSGDMGVYASGDTLALVYFDNPGFDYTLQGNIIFRQSTDGGDSWSTIIVAPAQNCLTRPTLTRNGGEYIIAYTNGTKILTARSCDGATWSTWLQNPDYLLGKTFENSPLVEEYDGVLRRVALDIPYPEYRQDQFSLTEDPDLFPAPHRFTDVEASSNDTNVYYLGADNVDGIVRCNTNLWIKQAAGWPVFQKPVITAGVVNSFSGTFPVDQVFLGGLIEDAPVLEMSGSPRQSSIWLGPTTYDPNRIIYVEVNGANYNAWLGQILAPVNMTTDVFSNYPPGLPENYLFTNAFSVRDTLWTPLPQGICADRTFFVNSKLWIKGTFSGAQTWAAADTIYLVGEILLSGTPEGTSPAANPADRVSIISEKSILLKYGYRSPADNQRRHPFCAPDDEPLSIYANLYAQGQVSGNPQTSGVFSFEYQHPHPSVPDYNLNGTLYTMIDLHRYRYPQTPGYAWASVNTPGSPNLKIDLPWYNPLWPEASPYLERGTISLWGSVNQMRRGYLHRSYADSEYPNPSGLWNPPLDLCGGSSSPAVVGHYDPVLGISLATANYPGATGSGVGYKREIRNDPRNTLAESRFNPDVEWDHSSPWVLGLSVYRKRSEGWVREITKHQLNRTHAKGYVRKGERTLGSVNDFLVAGDDDVFADLSPVTVGGGLITGLDICADGSALVAQQRLEGTQYIFCVSKIDPGTGNQVWEREYNVGNQMNAVVVLPNGQQLMARYDATGFLRIWRLNPPAAAQLVEVFSVPPFSPAIYDHGNSRLCLKALDDNTLDIVFALRHSGPTGNQPTTLFHARAQFTVPVDDPAAPMLPTPRLSVWPNPSAGKANFKLEGASAGDYRLDIYNLKGQLVNSLSLPAGGAEAELQWNGLDKMQLPVVKGIYLLRLSRDGQTLLRKRLCRI